MKTDTKTQLLNAAERAARRHGFDGFSYADLAAEVGIRKASIHHHFPTKSNLSTELVRRYATTFAGVCADIDATYESGGTRIAALIAQYRDALDDGHSLCLCVSFSTSRDSLPAPTIREINAFRARMTDWIAGAFAAGQADGTLSDVCAPQDEAAALLALLEGAQLAARAAQTPAPFDAALSMMQRRITAPIGA